MTENYESNKSPEFVRKTFWEVHGKDIELILKDESIESSEKARRIAEIKLKFLKDLLIDETPLLFHKTHGANLSSILENGLISREFAKKTDKQVIDWGYFGDPSEREFVYLTKGTPYPDSSAPSDLENIVIIDPSISAEDDPYYHGKRVRDQISSQQSILGIIATVVGRNEEGAFRSLTDEEFNEKLQPLLKFIQQRPDIAVPILRDPFAFGGKLDNSTIEKRIFP